MNEANTSGAQETAVAAGEMFVSEYSAPRGWARGIVIAFILVLVVVILGQFAGLLAISVFGTYVCLLAALTLAILERFIAHPVNTGQSRLEDPSEVEAFFVEANTIEPRVPGWESDADKQRPYNYTQRSTDLAKEVEDLRSIGSAQWSEYRVLPLKQMLVDFNKVDDLRALGQSLLAELKEYADDSTYRYDKEYYGKWKERIDSADRIIEDGDEHDCDDLERDRVAERLRAEVRTVLDHIADYQENWAKGSVLVRSLQGSCAIAVPVLIIMALLPISHPDGVGFLRILDWGLLGAAGSITAVMLALRTSDVVEVGNTQGKREVWRAVLGAVLGLVAGVLAFGIIGGGLLSGTAVPTVHSTEVMDIALTIVWGIGAGVSLERVFDHVRQISASM